MHSHACGTTVGYVHTTGGETRPVAYGTLRLHVVGIGAKEYTGWQ